MMGILREDHSTRTLDDAGAYERDRAPQDDPDRPSAREAAELEADTADALQRRADRRANAAARGEYVPHPGWELLLTVMGLALAQHRIVDVDLVPTRDGVARLDERRGRRGRVNVAAVSAALNDYEPGRYDVRDVDGVIWVKAEPATLAALDDPWDSRVPA